MGLLSYDKGLIRLYLNMLVMTKRRSAVLTKEGKWFVAQCVEVDVASQGETEEGALRNLKEALELHFESSAITQTPYQLSP